MKRRKRLVSAILCAVMILSCMPAYFAGAEDVADEPQWQDKQEVVQAGADADLAASVQQGLLTHLKLDGDVSDATGKGVPELKGSATYEAGINGQAIRFGGTAAKGNSNRVELTGRDDLKFTKDSTYSAGVWFKAKQKFPDTNIFGSKSWNKAGNAGWCLAMNSNTNGRMRFVPTIQSQGDEYYYATPSGNKFFDNSQWVYVVVTKGAGGNKIYVNGNAVSVSTTTTTTPDANTDGAVCLGADYLNHYGPGEVAAFDDLRMWDHELSAEEIKYLYDTTPELTVSGEKWFDISNEEEVQTTLSVKRKQVTGGEAAPAELVEWNCSVSGITIEPQGNGATAVVKIAPEVTPQTAAVEVTCRGNTETVNLEIVKDTAAASAKIVGKRAVLKMPNDTQQTYSVEFRNQYGTVLNSITDHTWSVEAANGVAISGSNTDATVTLDIPGDADSESTYKVKMIGGGFTEELSARLITKGVIPADLAAKVENRLAFDDTTDADQGGTITPAVSGTIGYQEGIQGKAAAFTKGNYLDLGKYDLAGKTINMAFKSNHFNGKKDPVIMANKDWDNPNQNGFVLAYYWNTQDTLRTRAGNGTANETFNMKYEQDQWMTLSMVFGADAYSFYMDGKLVKTVALDSWDANWVNNDTEGHTMKIGTDGPAKYGYNKSDSVSDYEFLLDNFTVYNTALTAAEQEELAVVNTQEVVPDEVIVHPLADVLDVDLGSGSAKDRSRYETEFTMGSGVTIANDATLGRDVLNMSSAADGDDVLYKVSAAQMDRTAKQFTFEAAFMVNDKKNQTIAGNTEKGGMSYEMNSSGRVELWLFSQEANKYVTINEVKPGFEVQTGQYYHAVTTYDGTTLKIYLNGKEVYSGATKFTLQHPPASDNVGFSIGGDPRKQFAASAIPLNGKVARVGVYSSALTKKQVGELYKEFQNPQQLTVASAVMTGEDTVAAQNKAIHTFGLDFAAENGKLVRITDRNNISWTLENAPAGVTLKSAATGKESVDVLVDSEAPNGSSFKLKAVYNGTVPPLEIVKTVQVENDGTGGNIKIAVLGDFQMKSTTSNDVIKNIKTTLQKYKEKNVDVIMIPGDITDDASAVGYDRVWELINSVYPDPNTRPKIVSCMGNHDYWNGHFQKPQKPNDLEAAKALYKQKMGVDLKTHDVVKGYHFIAVSPENDSTHGLFTQESIDFIKNGIAQAVAEDPTKPIFVMAHQHVRKSVNGVETPTVYLSDEWGNAALYDAMKDYPQVVFFSGHSHAPIDDERSIHQEDFTSIGTSSMNYLELEKGKEGGTKPDGYNKRAQSLYVEVTPSQLTVERWDKGVKMGSRPNWVIPVPATKQDFAYTNEKRNAARLAPVFAAGAKINASGITANTVTLKFPAATHADFVHSYRVEIKDKTHADTADKNLLYFSDFCVSVPNMSDTVSYTLPGLRPATDYEINVYAIESFGKESAPLSVAVKTTKPTIDPDDPKPAADVLDVRFDGGVAKDYSTYNTTLTPQKMSAGKDVTYGTDDTIHYDVLNCQKSALKAPLNSTQMAKITPSYSIETVVKLDAVNVAQSIFANTQSAGISLEINEFGVLEMWATIGKTQHRIGQATSSNPGFKMEAGRYYHLMGTYDGAQFNLYVDGEIIATKNASGSIAYAKGLPTYIGGDTNASGNIQAPITGQIALARLYSSGLTQTQVANLYKEYHDRATGVTPVVPTQAEISGPATVYVPKAETPATADYTVALRDASGNGIVVEDPENIVWSLSGAGAGVSIAQGSTGQTVKLSVTKEAATQKVKLIAEYPAASGQEKIKAEKEISISVQTAPSVPKSAQITGTDVIQTNNQAQDQQYVAKALDENGAEIAGAVFNWSILESDIDGVGINLYGLLHVEGTAKSGKVVIQAALKSDPTITAKKTITIAGKNNNGGGNGGGSSGGGQGSRPNSSAGHGGSGVVTNPSTNPGTDNNQNPSGGQDYVGGFKDMPKSHWASESTQKLLDKGVISGDTNGGLRPEDNITREETVKVLLLTLDKKVQPQEGTVDAGTSQWAKDYMLAAKEEGIVGGDELGNLNGQTDISRIDAMVMIARALGGEEGNVEALNVFADSNEIPDYAKASVAKLVELGIVQGYADGTIGAGQSISRAELFALMARIMK